MKDRRRLTAPGSLLSGAVLAPDLLASFAGAGSVGYVGEAALGVS